MPRIVVNGAALNFRETGRGELVVLLHGLGAHLGFWELHLVEELAARFRVVCLDLRGHGYSDMPASGYRPADIAQDVLALLDELDADRAHLVGHSYGGAVALELAVARPDRVASLVVADTRVRCLQPQQVLPASSVWPDFSRRMARQGVPLSEADLEIGARLLEMLGAARWDEARQRLADRFQFLPFARGSQRRMLAKWRRLMAETTAPEDFQIGSSLSPEQLALLRQPLLCLYGERSPYLESGHRLAETVSCGRLETVVDAGHFHVLVQPERFRRDVCEFLATPHRLAWQAARGERAVRSVATAVPQ